MINNSPVIAAIDIGTNSFHMVIASVNSKGTMRIITREKEMVRLGSGAGEMKKLKSDAIDRGIVALKRFVNIANNENAIIRAVATSAVREAENKNEFIEEVKNQCNIDIEVVSGSEEGRLIFIGMMHALPVFDLRTLLIDIGGGSTETVIGKNGKIIYSYSEKLGTIRVSQKFFPKYKTNKESIAQAREFIKGEWTPILRNIKNSGFELAVGTSGTIETIAKVANLLKGKNIPEVLNGYSLKAKDILDAIELIVNTSTPKEREKIPGMESKRADIVTGGALIIEYFLEYLQIEKITISPYALREGIVFETLQSLKDRKEYNHLSRLRFESVINICRQFNIDTDHAEAVKNYSLKIFDAISEQNELNVQERELLEAASYLHDIGYAISHDKHHKHSYYIIMNSDIPGFTNDETELIANIARYHRKSTPKKNHLNYSSLTPNKQSVVNVLSAILRISEGIDRRQLQLVKDLEIINNSGVEIRLIAEKHELKPDIELWQANRRKGILEKIIKKTIIFKI